MVFSIEKFASALCLARGTDEIKDKLPPECFVLTDHSDAIRTVIRYARLKFELEFGCFIHKLAENGRKVNLYLFAQTNIAFYVKMSKHPSYIKFMIICSLVDRLLSTQDCYCIAKVLSVCLIAVYYRCYYGLFKKKEKAGESFGSFCEELRCHYFNDVRTRPLPFSLQIEFILFADIKKFNCENFILNNSEVHMLNDALDFVEPEGNLSEFEVTSTTPFENNSSSIHATLPLNLHSDLSAIQPNLPEDTVTTTTLFVENDTFSAGASNGEEALGDLFSSENIDNSSRASKVCYLCQRRCFKYLEAFRGEVFEETILPLELKLSA